MHVFRLYRIITAYLGWRDPRSPGAAPEAGVTGNGEAGARRHRRADEWRWRQRAAALKRVLRESRKAGAVAVDTHGARIGGLPHSYPTRVDFRAIARTLTVRAFRNALGLPGAVGVRPRFHALDSSRRRPSVDALIL